MSMPVPSFPGRWQLKDWLLGFDPASPVAEPDPHLGFGSKAHLITMVLPRMLGFLLDLSATLSCSPCSCAMGWGKAPLALGSP